MKKFRLFFALMLLLSASSLYAQIVNLSNMSAEWIRTGNRNAATDAADIVYYNPAGLTKLADGIHLNVSNQTMIRRPEHTADYGEWGDKERTYSHDGIDWFLPNAYAAYKKDNWAVFTGFCIPAGGASVNYPDGSATTQMIGAEVDAEYGGLVDKITDQSLKASSVYYTGILGGSYAINEMFSIAAGGRYIYAKNTAKVKLTAHAIGTEFPLELDTEETASGFSGVIGVNITPLQELNIGMKYETVTKLDFKTDVNKNDLGDDAAKDGEKNRYDLPAIFAIGAAYAVTPELTLEYDFTYYFQSQADWGKDDNGDKYAEHAGDCYGTGIAAVYKATPVITASAGICYTDFLWDDEDAYYTRLGSYETLYSDNVAFLIGAAYEVVQGVKLNLGYDYTWWKSETLKFNGIKVDTKNATHVLSVGADCTF